VPCVKWGVDMQLDYMCPTCKRASHAFCGFLLEEKHGETCVFEYCMIEHQFKGQFPMKEWKPKQCVYDHEKMMSFREEDNAGYCKLGYYLFDIKCTVITRLISLVLNLEIVNDQSTKQVMQILCTCV